MTIAAVSPDAIRNVGLGYGSRIGRNAAPSDPIST